VDAQERKPVEFHLLKRLFPPVSAPICTPCPPPSLDRLMASGEPYGPDCIGVLVSAYHLFSLCLSTLSRAGHRPS
jgi:hypothetical protein